MDEFLILLQAKLDEAKSKGNVNADIDEIQTKLDKLKIQAEIDPKTITELTRQLENILNQKIVISNINVDQSKAVKSAQQTGQQIGNAINQGVENSVKKAANTLKTFSDLRSFSDLNKSISNIHVDASELRNYKTILDEIKDTYSEFGQVRITNETFNNGILEKFKVNIEQVNGDLKETKSFMMSLNDEKDTFVFNGLIAGSENVVQHLDKTKNAVNQTAEAINALKEKAQIDKIQLSMSGRGKIDYNWQVDEEIKKLKNLGFTEEEVAQQVKVLTDAHIELKRVIDSNEFDSFETKNKAIIESDKERTLALNQVKNAYKELKTDANQYYNLNKQSKLSTDIQNWLSKNSRASKEAKESLNAYYRELSDGRVSVDRLNYIEQELKNIDATQRGLGKLGKNLKDQFKEASASFTQWLSVSSAVMALVYQLQRIPKEVIAVNSAMIELNKVSDASASDIKKYFDEAAESAKRYGSAVSDMIDATADWSRLGYSLPNAKKLAEAATLYTNVGDGIDMSTANESLISTLQGFQLEAEDAMGIIDRFNEVNLLAS